MSDDRRVIGWSLLAIVGLIALVVWAGFATKQSDHEQIHTWAKQNGYIEVISIDKPGFFEVNPFWFNDEDDRFYKANLKNKREQRELKWFRFRYWSMDVHD